ncbi:MAG: hypothetical protein R3F20_00695 [Planctomycetota bacterium]
MTPEDRELVHRLLRGGLDRDETIAALDRIRGSEEARDYLAYQTQRTRGASRIATDRPMRPEEAEGPVSPRVALPEPPPEISSGRGILAAGGKRGGMRRTVFIGLIVILLFGFAQKMRTPKDRPLVSTDMLVAEAVEAGLPWIESPRGALKSRPKVIRLVMPAGNSRVTIRMMRAGALVHSAEFDARETPEFFEDVERPRAEGRLKAVEAILPFPGPDELPLGDGDQLHVFAVLPNDLESPPVSILLR